MRIRDWCNTQEGRDEFLALTNPSIEKEAYFQARRCNLPCEDLVAETQLRILEKMQDVARSKAISTPPSQAQSVFSQQTPELAADLASQIHFVHNVMRSVVQSDNRYTRRYQAYDLDLAPEPVCATARLIDLAEQVIVAARSKATFNEQDILMKEIARRTAFDAKACEQLVDRIAFGEPRKISAAELEDYVMNTSKMLSRNKQAMSRAMAKISTAVLAILLPALAIACLYNEFLGPGTDSTIQHRQGHQLAHQHRQGHQLVHQHRQGHQLAHQHRQGHQLVHQHRQGHQLVHQHRQGHQLAHQRLGELVLQRQVSVGERGGIGETGGGPEDRLLTHPGGPDMDAAEIRGLNHRSYSNIFESMGIALVVRTRAGTWHTYASRVSCRGWIVRAWSRSRIGPLAWRADLAAVSQFSGMGPRAIDRHLAEWRVARGPHQADRSIGLIDETSSPEEGKTRRRGVQAPMRAITRASRTTA